MVSTGLKWAVRVAALSLGVLSLGGAGCAGPQGAAGGGCRYDSWQGQCALTSVRTARIVERFPRSYVVMEALYEPKAKDGEFAPPPFRKETIAPAEYELDLADHIRKYPLVHCVVQDPVGDPCAPTMAAAVPAFEAPSTPEVAHMPVGCNKIEHAELSAPLATPVELPGPFQFEENSAAAGPVVNAVADDVAKALRDNPRIECVAIKGESAPGEAFSLANDRAQEVRRLLEARGIDHSRVTVFEATAPTYTATPDAAPALPERRRVHLSVVVYAPDQPAVAGGKQP
ncbi:MAG: hypothetical protein ACRENC_17270 [Gemmatimonadaceae bacterium]